MTPLLEAPTPRTPLAFLELERRVAAAAGQQADGIVGHQLIKAHEDPEFVAHAVAATRERHGPLRQYAFSPLGQSFPQWVDMSGSGAFDCAGWPMSVVSP